MTAASSELPPILNRVWAETLAAARRPPLDDNVDPERFPGGMPVLTPAQSTERRAHLAEHGAEWQWLNDRLDPGSRQLLSQRLVFYVLGHAHARIGPSPDELRGLVRTANEQLVTARDVTPLRYAGSPSSHRFDLRPLGFPVTLESYMLGIQGTFQLQQYRCPTHPAARPKLGDIAIDAGGCFGETALWLADAVGAAGRVLTLEFDVDNLVLLRDNLERNPSLASRITLLDAALWSRSGSSLQIAMSGPAAMVSASDGPAGDAAGGSVARSVALDDLIADGVIDRVDFVKLDIEGAEPMALVGAVRVLERFRPRLALATYHDIDHLWQLPRFLADLQLGYRFSIGHFTMHDEETVLYGWVPAGPTGARRSW
jgi:FkbM family methyltransferase